MDQQTANLLLEQGAVILFLDAPANFNFGIDCYSWRTGPNFKGLKLIPPGQHFVYYSSVATAAGGESAGIRSGFWLDLKPRQVVVKRWNPATEDALDDAEMDAEETERYRINFRDFDRFLGVYPLLPTDSDPVSPYQKWLRLTTHITPAVAKRMLPPSGKISAMSCVSRFSDVDDARGEFRSRGRDQNRNSGVDTAGTADAATLPPQKAAGGDVEVLRLEFTPIDIKRSFPTGASGAERTKYSIDKSYLLSHVLKTFFKDYKELLGELQLSFVLFLIGEVYDGYEQWKLLVHLLCQSDEAIDDLGATLFYEFLEILIKQLEAHPSDFFMDALSSDNFVRANILLLTRSMSDRTKPAPKNLHEALEALLAFVDTRFQWDVRRDARLAELEDDADEGEYAPVVV
ncbi:a1-alpha2 repression [Geranomyces michiganensis]|nr:a1-alpha2 repression [Geranomyces michiganensis]